MRKFLEAAVIFVVTFGWWGFVYPELSMVTESVAQEAETTDEEVPDERKLREEGAQTSDEKQFGAEAAPLMRIGEKLGSTGIVRGNLRIKSRIAEYLYQGKEKDKAEKESGYE